MSTEQSTNSGEIEDLRDQIFLFKRRSLFFFILNRNASTKLPFHIDRRGMNSEFLRFDSAPARNPALVGFPQGETEGLPPFVRPSPPPWGWSTGFIATPRTKGRLPNHRLCTAFLSLRAPWLGLETLPIVARHRESMSFSTPEGGRTSLRESVGGAGSFIILAKVPAARAGFAPWPGWHSISCTHVPIRISVNGMQFPIW